MEEKRIERISVCMKTFADVDRQVLPIVGKCLDGMTNAAESIEPKAVSICLFIHLVNYFLVVTILIGNKSYNLEKPVYFPLNGATIVRKMHLWVEYRRMWVLLMKNLEDLLDD